jgi:hypothetical protein
LESLEAVMIDHRPLVSPQSPGLPSSFKWPAGRHYRPRPAAHVSVFLAVEGDVADLLVLADRTGGSQERSYGAGVVVGSRRAGNGVVIGPEEDLGSPRVAGHEIARLVYGDHRTSAQMVCE